MTPSTMTSPSPRSLDSRTHSSRGESAVDLLMRHDGAAPRYTSYPPANFFTESPDRIADELLDASGRDDSGSLSLYFHVPFCPRRCLFCGCHTEIGRTGSFIRDYMETLPLEFRLLAKRLNLRPGGRRVTQIHFGGGTPNSVPYSHLEDLLVQVASTCDLAPDVEIAMECDPGLVLAPQLEKLRGMGFNRISFGIQDIDPQVLKAVNRASSKLPPRNWWRCAGTWGSPASTSTSSAAFRCRLRRASGPRSSQSPRRGPTASRFFRTPTSRGSRATRPRWKPTPRRTRPGACA